jgi:hypothetical protein
MIQALVENLLEKDFRDKFKSITPEDYEKRIEGLSREQLEDEVCDKVFGRIGLAELG